MNTDQRPARVAPDWIAVDWGTSHLRAWAMRGLGEVLAEARSDAGMGTLTPDGFEPALLDLLDEWLPARGRLRVVACGMVGARQGWVEAPYAVTPCPPLSGPLTRAPGRDSRLDVRIVPGIRQDKPADVMRGEETQVAGFLALSPDFDGVLCLPGTHCKWVRLSAGEIVGFRTFMTGELFDLLATRSVLRHGIGKGWDDAAFADAVDDAISQPEQIAGRLFSLRAEGLLSGLSPDAARARLSGLLIGAELAAARPWWLGQDVAIVGASGVAAAYAAALGRQGVAVATAPDPDGLTRAGLARAREMETDA